MDRTSPASARPASSRGTARLRRDLLAGVSAMVMASCMAATPVLAQQATWIGPNGGNWSTAANWSDGMVPTHPTPTQYQYNYGVSIDNGTEAVVSAPAEFTLVGSYGFRIGGAPGTALTISGNGSLNVATGNMQIGSAAGTEGTVTVRDGGTLRRQGLTNPNNYGAINVGGDGTGRLEVLNGGLVYDITNLSVQSAESSVRISGDGSEVVANSLFAVTRGTLTIENGGTGAVGAVATSSGSVTIGIGSGADGSVIVTGSGSELMSIGGSLYRFQVGATGGKGNLLIADGGKASTGRVWVAQNDGSQGTVTVTGANSSLVAETQLTIGATLRTNLALDAGSGTVVVEHGASATVTGDTAIALGNRGPGVLTVADGGTVTASGISVGSASDGDGTLNIGAAAGEDARAAGTLDLRGGAIAFGEGAGRIVFNHTATDVAALDFGHRLTSGAGSAAIDHIRGTTTYSGDGSAFAGLTTVSGGTLLVTDRLGGAFDVTGTPAGGGTLGGIGTIGTAATGLTPGSVTTIATGGTLSPGLSGQIGTLNVAGDLVFEAGSAYAVDIKVDGGLASDRVVVGGTATMDNAATVRVNSLDGDTFYAAGQTYDYTILSAGALAGGFAGTFETLFLEGTVQNAGNDVTLAVKRKGSGPVVPVDPTKATWIGPDGGNWSTAANWSNGLVPANSQDDPYPYWVSIDSGTEAVVTAPNAGYDGGDLYVGGAPGSALTVSGNGSLNVGSPYMRIGFAVGTEGTVTVKDGGTLTRRWALQPHRAAGNISVGLSGNGRLEVLNGGLVYDVFSLAIGADTTYRGGSGYVLVSGPGSEVAIGQSIAVGGDNNATLRIENGGKVQTGAVNIGFLNSVDATAPSNGADVIVTGAGSELVVTPDVTGTLTVAARGREGRLTVSDGGKVTAKNVFVGRWNEAAGTVTVTGNGSALIAESTLAIGAVDILWDFIGETPGRGTMLVERNGRVELQGTAPVQLGHVGHGTLTLADGGSIEAAGVSLAGTATGTGILNIGAAAGDDARAAGTLDLRGGAIAFGEGAGRIVFNHTATEAAALDFGHALTSGTGSSAIDHIRGFTTYSGDGSAFAGLTTVSGGTLLVTDRLGGAFGVSGTGVLGGTGTIGTAGLATTIGAGGILSPGLSGQIGTLNVAGDLVFAAGSTYAVDIRTEGGPAGDRVVVAGAATISDQAEVRVSSLSGETFYTAGQTYDYTILSAGTLAGGFAGTPAFETLFLEGTVQNSGNDVVLAVRLKGSEPVEPVDPADPDNPVWTGPNGGDWFTAGNWDTGTVPDGTNYAGNLTIANGGGPVIDRAGAVTKATSTRLDIGSATRHGALTITGAGTLNSQNTFIDSGSGTASSVTVTNGGAWSLAWPGNPTPPTRAATLRVGDAGKGNLTISAGGKVTGASTVTVAAGAGSEGAITVTGADSLLSATSVTVAAGAGSTGAVTVTGDGALISLSSMTVSGAGAGSLAVLDKGRATLTGTLQVGYANGGNGTVRVDGEGSVLQASNVQIANSGGSGAVLVENGGKLVAAGRNDIGYGGAGTGTMTLADGGTLEGGSVTLGFFGGKGVLNIGAAEGQGPRGAGVLNLSQNIIYFGSGFGTNDGTLVFNHDETDYELSATLLRSVNPTSGSRAIRHLAGTTIYSGNSVDIAAGQYAFDGTTSVLGGTLLVTGKLGGAFDVSGTGVLGGTGTIGTAASGTEEAPVPGSLVTIASGGTLSPGLSGQIGTLNVAGDLVFEAGSIYAVDINSDRESDLVNVGGTATVNGGANVWVNSLSGETFYEAGTTYDYTILSAGTLSGAFNGSFETLFLEGTVQNSGNDVVLAVNRKVRDTNNPVWTGEDGGDWFDEDNWDTGIVPDSTNFTGRLTIASDGPVIDEAGATAYGTRFDVGGADGRGSLTITGAGHLTSHNSFIDSATAEASSVLVTEGGTWRLYELRSPQAPRSSALRVGDTGKGALMISAGGKVIDGSTVTVAAAAGSEGEVTVTGEGSLLAANAITVSGGGRGLLSVLDKGGVTVNNTIQVGYASGGDGRVRIDGEGSTLQAGNVQIANAGGGGAVLVENGGKLVATSGTRGVDIGYGGTGTGVLTLADGGVLETSAISLGFFGGTGVLNIGAAEGQAVRGAGVLNLSQNIIYFGSGFGTNDGTLVFNHDETAYELSATLLRAVNPTSGSRAIRHLAGTTIYSGNSVDVAAGQYAFDGTTSVLGGTLLVTGKLGGAFDVSGGVLGGTGTIGAEGLATTIASDGTLSPGLAGRIGTLNVAGDLTFASGSTYAVHVNSDRESDLVNVAGTATIDGGAAVRVTSLSGETFYEEGTTYDYTILSAATLSGGFAEAPAFESLFLDGTVQNAGNDVVLAVNKKAEPQNPVTFEQFAETDNQIATARALDSLETLLAGRLMEVLFTEEQARETYDQLSGAQHASTQAALVQDGHFVRDAINDRIRDAFRDVAAPDLEVMAYGPDVRTPKDAPFDAALARTQEPALWASGFGAWGRMEGGTGIGDVERATGGVLIGGDAPVFESWRLGLLAGFSRSSFDTATSEGASDSYHLGVYAGAQWGALSFRSGLSYTWHDIDTRRTVIALSETLTADYDAGALQAFGELGYRIDAGSTAFEPYASLAHVRLKTDGFTETGGLSALTVAGDIVNTTFTTLGVRVASTFDLGSAQAVARGGLGWRHAFGDVDPRSVNAFAGSDSFTVSGVPIAKNVAVIEAGLDLKVSPSAVFGLSYNGQFSSDAYENGVNARFRVSF